VLVCGKFLFRRNVPFIGLHLLASASTADAHGLPSQDFDVFWNPLDVIAIDLLAVEADDFAVDVEETVVGEEGHLVGVAVPETALPAVLRGLVRARFLRFLRQHDFGGVPEDVDEAGLLLELVVEVELHDLARHFRPDFGQR